MAALHLFLVRLGQATCHTTCGVLYVSQRLATCFVRMLSECRLRLVKNTLIHLFVACFKIDMHEANDTDPFAYPSFDAFFTRTLHPRHRPIDPIQHHAVCPTDGQLVDHGLCARDCQLVAKFHRYSLSTLLAEDADLLNHFDNAYYATFYLAPYNYHRIHMPLAGQLLKTIHVPGWLYSVHPNRVQKKPKIYAHNERLICLFNTAHGPMAVIMIGACLVGSMSTTWGRRYQPMGQRKPSTEYFEEANIKLEKGAEMGTFHYGSSVMILLPKTFEPWHPPSTHCHPCQYGQTLGEFKEITPP